MSYTAEVLADSPIGYWRLDDTSGSTAVDSSGNAHAGTYRNSPTLNQTGLLVGDANPAVLFNGSNQDVNLSNPSALRVTSAWTLEAWVKIPSGETSDAAVIAYEYDGARVTYFLGFFDGSATSLKPSCGFYNGSWHTVQAASSVSLDVVHHIVGTWDGTNLKIYVDGSLANTATPGSSPSSGTGNFLLAARWDNAASPAKYKGILDEAAIYGADIGATRIGVHYTAGSTNPDGTATPAQVAGIGAAPAPTAFGAATAAPGVVADTGAVPAPTAFAGSAGLATPSEVAVVGAVPAPTTVGASNGLALPARVAGLGSVPAGMAVGGSSATALPLTVVGTGRVPHPLAEGQGTGGGGGSDDGVNDFWVIEALG